MKCIHVTPKGRCGKDGLDTNPDLCAMCAEYQTGNGPHIRTHPCKVPGPKQRPIAGSEKRWLQSLHVQPRTHD